MDVSFISISCSVLQVTKTLTSLKQTHARSKTTCANKEFHAILIRFQSIKQESGDRAIEMSSLPRMSQLQLPAIQELHETEVTDSMMRMAGTEHPWNLSPRKNAGNPTSQILER